MSKPEYASNLPLNLCAVTALLAASILPLSDACAQTTLNWRTEATNGSWNDANNWWNGTGTQSPPGSEFLRFNNNNQLAMTNDAANTGRYRIYFEAGATSGRTIGGSILNTFYDFGTVRPAIQNDSTATHTINFPIAVGPSFDLEINPVLGNLTLGGTVSVPTGRNIQVWGANGKTLTFNGQISGAGGLSMEENSIVILSGTQSFTGSVAVKAGTLQLSGSAFDNTPRSYAISNGAVMNITATTGVATGTSTISGAGTLRISGGNFANNTGGGRTLNMSMASGGSIDIQNGAKLQNGGWSSFVWTSNLASINVAGTLDMWDGGTVRVDALTGGGTINKGIGNSNPTLIVGVNNGDGDFSGVINAPFGSNYFTLQKDGTGTQTLSGTADNPSARAIVNNGTLVLAKTSSASAHAIGVALTVSGGTLRLGGTGGDQIYDNVIPAVNSGTFDLNGLSETVKGISGSGGTVNNASGTQSVLTINHSTITNSGVVSYSGSINGNTRVVLTNSSAKNSHLQAFAGSNGYTGGTLIDNGHLRVTSDAGLGAVPVSFDAANITLQNGGVLQNNDSSPVLSANRGIYLGTGGGVIYAGWGTNRSFTIPGAISGPGSLTQDDGAPVIFSGTAANTYAGGTLFRNGRMDLAKSAGVNAIPGNITFTGNPSWGGSQSAAGIRLLANEQIADSAIVTWTAMSNAADLRIRGFTETIGGLVYSDNNAYAIVENNGPSDNVAGNGTLILNVTGANSYSFNGQVRNQNSGGTSVLNITKSGTGTQTFAGNMITYTGATAVGQGRLILLNTATAFDSASTTISPGAVLEFNTSLAGNTQQLNAGGQTISGAGTLEKTGPGQLWFGASGQTVNISLGSGALIDVKEGILRNEYSNGNWSANKADLNIATGATVDLWDANITVDGLTGSGTVNKGYLNTHTLTIGVDNAPSAIFAGTIKNTSGTLALTKTGTGTQTLSGDNTYSGATTINDGLLIVSGGNGVGDFSNVTLANVATARMQLNAGETINSLAGGAASGVNLQGNTLTIGNPLGTATTTYDGVISGDGGGSLIRRGAGTTTLAGTNTFTGQVTVKDGGTLSVLGFASLGTGSSAINLSEGSTLAITTGGSTSRGLALTTTGGNLNISSGTTTISGSITGDTNSAHFTKSGAGIFNQSGAGNWSGNFTVNGGTYNVTSTGSISNAGTTSVTGAILNIDTSTLVRASSVNVSSSGALNLNAGALRTNGITVAALSSFTWGAGTLTVQNADSGSSGSTDRSGTNGSGGAASGPVIYEGTVLNVNNGEGTLATSSGSILDLGGLYTSGVLRYDQLKVTGALNLTAANDILNVAISPYRLRPSGPNDVATGDWGTLRLVLADSFTMNGLDAYMFDQVTGITSDMIGWSSAGTGTNTNTNPFNLAMDTYFIEYRTSGVQSGAAILFHYKVSGSVPEPASAGLLVAGALLLRALRRRK